MANEPAITTGIILVLFGAFASGSFGLMLKYCQSWKWEHIWLVYSLIGMLIVPLGMGYATVVGLQDILNSADKRNLGLVFLFGLGWGVGAVLYGVALKAVGLALSFAVVMGLTAAIGSLAPLVLLHASEVPTLRGCVIIAGVLLMVGGVAVAAWAGHLKEVSLGRAPGVATERRSREGFRWGLSVAVLSGILSPMLNLSFAFGDPLILQAIQRGTDPVFAANVVWVVALGAGVLVNATYCCYLISRENSWKVLLQQRFHYGLALTMAILWSAGYLFYGFGASMLGRLAAVVGWPLMSGMTIISANLWGLYSGEWSNTGRTPVVVMGFSILILCASMAVVAWGDTLR